MAGVGNKSLRHWPFKSSCTGKLTSFSMSLLKWKCSERHGCHQDRLNYTCLWMHYDVHLNATAIYSCSYVQCNLLNFRLLTSFLNSCLWNIQILPLCLCSRVQAEQWMQLCCWTSSFSPRKLSTWTLLYQFLLSYW